MRPAAKQNAAPRADSIVNAAPEWSPARLQGFSRILRVSSRRDIAGQGGSTADHREAAKGRLMPILQGFSP